MSSSIEGHEEAKHQQETKSHSFTANVVSKSPIELNVLQAQS